MEYSLKGIVIGLIVAAPLGPVGLLCVRRTLAHGRVSGQLSGLGAATAHGFYGLIVGFGLTSISSFLLKSQVIIGIIGGLFLCYLGVKTFYARPASHTAIPHGSKRLQNYFSTLGLAITNPLTILTFIGIFAGFSVQSEHLIDPLLLVAGIFLGSALWWLCLTFLVGLFRHRMTPRSMLIMNRASGIFIFCFGVAALAR